MSKTSNAVSYDHDLFAWADQQAEFLRTGQLSQLDLEHLAEEIGDMGRREKKELMSRMRVLLGHLIKWQYQPQFRGSSWQTTIRVQRMDTQEHLDDSPSLKPLLTDPDWSARAWLGAVDLASRETGFSHTTFPDECPWTIEQVFDSEFWPNG